MVNKKTDEQLAEDVQAGDKSAFKLLYQRHFDYLYRYVRARVRTDEVAEDLVSEVFVKAFKKIDQFNQQSRFKTWLYSIARFRVVDWYREQGKVQRFSIQNLLPSVEFKFGSEQDLNDDSREEGESSEPDYIEEVREILDKLPERYAEVLNLRFIADMKISEVADTLDLTESNVKVIQHRAIKKAKKLMGVESK